MCVFWKIVYGDMYGAEEAAYFAKKNEALLFQHRISSLFPSVSDPICIKTSLEERITELNELVRKTKREIRYV